MAPSTTKRSSGSVNVVAVLLGLHLVVHTLHGIPHRTIPVTLDPAVTATVLVVVYVLPIAGGLLIWRGSERAGIATVTVAMGISLALATTLHFVVESPDNVAAISADPWRLTFISTAAGITIVDGLGVLGGVWAWRTHGPPDADRLQGSGRIPGVAAAGFRPFTRLTYWLSRRMVGEVPEPLTVTAHHPGLLAGRSAYEIALENADQIDDGLKELVVLKAAMVAGCEFCLDIGTAQARAHGVTEAQLRDLHRFETSDAFSERERLALRYAVAMTRTPVDVPDALFDDLEATLDEAALVELTAAIAFENYRARFNHAFEIEAQGFAEGSYCPRPEGQVGEREMVEAPGPNESV